MYFEKKINKLLNISSFHVPVICTIFGLVAEINVGVELSVRMSSRMSQVVSTCDVLVVVATAGAGVYGAPRRMRNMLKFMENIASVREIIAVADKIPTRTVGTTRRMRNMLLFM